MIFGIWFVVFVLFLPAFHCPGIEDKYFYTWPFSVVVVVTINHNVMSGPSFSIICHVLGDLRGIYCSLSAVCLCPPPLCFHALIALIDADCSFLECTEIGEKMSLTFLCLIFLCNLQQFFCSGVFWSGIELHLFQNRS